MGALADIIGAISTEVVRQLAAGGYPALVDGKIAVGTAAEFEQLAPPRIIFDLSPGSEFVPAEYYSGGSAVIHTDERAKEGAQRSVAGDNVMITVHCWGVDTGSTDPIADYDATRTLAHAVRAACQALLPGAFGLVAKAKYRSSGNVVRLGRWLTFDLVIYTPILETLLPYDRDSSYASDTVTSDGTDELVVPETSATTGPSETGCT